MKKLVAVLSILGFGIFGASGAVADGVNVFGSYWDPSDGDETLGAGISLRGGTEPLYLQLRGTFYDDITEDTALFENDLQVIPADVGIGVQIEANDRVELYGGGGVSYYFLDSENGSIDDEVGWYLEAGTELGVSEDIGVFVEGVWRTVEGTVDDDADDVDFDDVTIDLDGVSVNLGVVFRW